MKVTILHPRWFPQTFRLDIVAQSIRTDVAHGGLVNATAFNIIEPKNKPIYLEYGNSTITEFDYKVDAG